MTKKITTEWGKTIYGEGVLSVSCKRGKLTDTEVYEALEKKQLFGLFVHLVNVRDDNVPSELYDPGDTWELYEPYDILPALEQYNDYGMPVSEWNDSLGEGDIKNCPFCGGEAQVDECITCAYVHVKCMKCGAIGPNMTPTEETADKCRKQVIRLWNKRCR